MAFYSNQSTRSLNRETHPWSFTLKDDGPTRWDMLTPYSNDTLRIETKIEDNRNPLNVERPRPISSSGIQDRARAGTSFEVYSSQGPRETIELHSTTSFLNALDQSGIQMS